MKQMSHSIMKRVVSSCEGRALRCWSSHAHMLLVVSTLALATGPIEWVGPTSPQSQPEWLASIKKEKRTILEQINYTGGVFGVPELAWTADSYIQPQMHPYDRKFWDHETGAYTVHRFLDDLQTRYGGVDSVLVWPTYTNIGIDDRNQFDYFRSMPGGLDGVKQITEEFKAAGVRVLWPYNPWDTGTRREDWDKNATDERTFALLLKQTSGDGFNGDTMDFVPRSFWDAAVERQYPLAFEPEGGGHDESLNWQTMGWGYWSFGSHVPVVDRFKYLTSGRFLTNACDRWAKNKTDNLQTAWFNGAGCIAARGLNRIVPVRLQ